MNMELAIKETHDIESAVVTHLLIADFVNTIKHFNVGAIPEIDNGFLVATCQLYFDEDQEIIIKALGGEKEKAFDTFVSVVRLTIDSITIRHIDRMRLICNPISERDYMYAILWMADWLITGYESKYYS